MKIHSTNYFDTFIEVAEDTKAEKGTPPPAKTNKSVAESQFEMIANAPYKYSSDDVLFSVFAERNGISKAELKQAREQFFSKGQPCFRTSPLMKTYGYGLHSNHEGKIALVPMEEAAYQKFLEDKSVKKVKAMKSSR